MASEPRKHHYIPEFYLKGWADENGRMWRYDRPHTSVVHKQVYASQVGFVQDLYSIPGVSPDRAQKIESVWFNQVDHQGSVSLAKLLSAPEHGWNSDSRSAWSRFVISIIHRTPENLEAFKESMRMIWEDTAPEVQERYEKIRKPNDPERYEDYARTTDPLVVEKIAIHAIQGAINNEKMGRFINNMHWKIFDLTESKFSLLISDALLVMSNGLEKHDGHITMPLSPKKLFVATHKKEFLSEFKRLSPQQLSRRANQLVVGRAKRFIVATNRDQEAFIEKRFGTDDTPSLMNTVLSQVQTDRGSL
jgi:Protein of unknown function (DUF4238)